MSLKTISKILISINNFLDIAVAEEVWIFSFFKIIAGINKEYVFRISSALFEYENTSSNTRPVCQYSF